MNHESSLKSWFTKGVSPRKYEKIINEAYSRLEEQTKSDDPADFHIGRLEVAASLLAEVVGARVSGPGSFRLDHWTLFHNIKFCTKKIDGVFSSTETDRASNHLWHLLRKSIHALSGWWTESQTIIHAANVVFVATNALRQLHKFPDPVTPLGIERGLQICSCSLPFPIGDIVDVAERAEIMTRNLQWLLLKTEERSGSKNRVAGK